MVEQIDDKVSYTYSFTVKAAHLDSLDHVNNIVYLQWVQDASERHWNTLASVTIQEENIWVAMRHEIDYIHQAFLEDTITVTTWIDSSQGAKSIRKVAISCGDILLVQCVTTWVLLDKVTLKPKRIPKEILRLFIK